MNKDIRIGVDFFHHHKTKRLKRKLGLEGVFSLQMLWCYAARHRPKGSLTDMDAIDIASVADWESDEQEFVSTLCEIGFLEQCEEGVYHIHDWETHNPYAAFSEERSESARKAAKTRWAKKDKAEDMRPACDPHSDPQTKCNAPSPSPSPSPSPDPEEEEERKADAAASSSPEKKSKEYVAEIQTQEKSSPLRITKQQAEKWQKTFKFIDVEAELYKLSLWSEENPEKRWTKKSAFHATARALGNSNQRALYDQHARDPTFDPSDPNGDKEADAKKRKILELTRSMATADPYGSA